MPNSTKTLITTTGYHLRDPELDLLNARIAIYNKDHDQIKHYLQKSQQRLEEMGYWFFLPEWERINVEFEQDLTD